MTRILTLDGAITDTSKPILVTLESLEAQIMALTPRGWWDASNPAYRTDVSGKASQVNDRSGNALHFQQATSANRPPVTTNFWGALNGVNRDALTFDRTTDYKMLTAGNVFDSTTVWTMALIASTIDPGGVASPFSLPGTNRFELDLQTGGKGWRANGQTTTILTAQTNNVLVIMSYNYPGSGSVTETMYVTDLGGTTTTRAVTYALGTTSPVNSGLLLGTLGAAGGFGFKGSISELFAFKADLSTNAPALALLQQYFQMKYRTP